MKWVPNPIYYTLLNSQYMAQVFFIFKVGPIDLSHDYSTLAEHCTGKYYKTKVGPIRYVKIPLSLPLYYTLNTMTLQTILQCNTLISHLIFVRHLQKSTLS